MVIIVIPNKLIFYCMEIFPYIETYNHSSFFDDDGNKRKRGSKGILTAIITSILIKLVHLGDGVRRVWPKSLIH